MIIRVRRIHPEAVLPTYAKPGDAALDLTALDYAFDPIHKFFEYRTGLQFEIPEGHVGLLFPRSSLSTKDLYLTNHVGVLDSGFRGEVTFRYKPLAGSLSSIYKRGDRIGQILVIPLPTIIFVESDTLTSTERGSGGYGSSNK